MDEASYYDFELPKELIAQQPVARRSDARLLVVHRRTGEWEHAHVRDLSQWLVAGDQLVLNDSRVVPARLMGVRTKTGGRWQGLFLDTGDDGVWRLLCKTRGKLEPGEWIRLINREAGDDIRLQMVARLDEGMWAVKPESPEETFAILQRVGRVPLPPYIRGGRMIEQDLQWYQTVYAARPGSVAAPTAGLHLTESLLKEVQTHGIGTQNVTLHVGMGTFRPMTAERLEDHTMHAEWGEISADTTAALHATRQAGHRIVAVGTTSVRVLESASTSGTLMHWSGQTQLFIRPPYRFRSVDALMTNFHLPRSTLLVLVSAFAGSSLIRKVYQDAIRERYRFFSYGDAMLIV